MGVYNLEIEVSGGQAELTGELGANDVVILAWVLADPAAETAVARAVKQAGATLIGLFPFERETPEPSNVGRSSRSSHSQRALAVVTGEDGDDAQVAEAKELCDHSFDNLSGDVHGVLSVAGYDTKIIPTTTLMNNYMHWALVGAYVQALESRGEAPYYWMSLHVPGGQEYDDAVLPHAQERGW